MRRHRELRCRCHSRCIYFTGESWNRDAWFGRIMCWSKLKLPFIRTPPQGRLLGCHWRGRLVGSYRGRGSAGNGNVAMRMYTRTGFDNKCLADWSHIAGQGNTGEQEIIVSVGSSTDSKGTSGSATMSRALYRNSSNCRTSSS
jgi:hypothetical protein